MRAFKEIFTVTQREPMEGARALFYRWRSPTENLLNLGRSAHPAYWTPSAGPVKYRRAVDEPVLLRGEPDSGGTAIIKELPEPELV